MAAGARFDHVPYYDPIRRGITFDKMLDGLALAHPGDVVLMQGVYGNVQPFAPDAPPQEAALPPLALSVHSHDTPERVCVL